MDAKTFLAENLVIFDGGMGTLLQARGMRAGEKPEEWNLLRAEDVVSIHRAYFEAGASVVTANTFGANLFHFEKETLSAIVSAALENARRAREESAGEQEKFIALSLGPSGKLLKPLGDLDFEDAVAVFSETVRLGVEYGAEIILIETMNDSLETKAALLAAKENSALPVVVSNAYGADGHLMTGASPEAMVALLEGMGADVIGANCSLGPKGLRGVAQKLVAASSTPVLLMPNAGLPRVENGKTVFDVSPAEFAEEVRALVDCGVRLVGGCCGTTPEYIRALSAALEGVKPVPIAKKEDTVLSSYTHTVHFGKEPLLIGERINPTGKPRLKEALKNGDLEYVLNEGVRQEQQGVHVLDVNVGLPGIDEARLLTETVRRLQAVTDLPLQIDTASAQAMESALRAYNGKALVNSVNGKEESMRSVFPLVKRYGGVVVALTLDENGIPESAEGRVEIARRILAEAARYGIAKKDLVFDPLAMAVSADARAAKETLRSVKLIRETLGCHTLLGVSNVSFGLPAREVIGSTFFAMALQNGLSAAILNPHSEKMMQSYYSFRALFALDENLADYIAAAEEFSETTPAAAARGSAPLAGEGELQNAILKGLKESAAHACRALLEKTDALSAIDLHIIPALNSVGEGFEKGRVFLPQLLMSAEAAGAAFDVVREAFSAKESAERGKVVLATVEGDVHDIGKNIVRMLLENYGFAVLDLGKDVPPEAIVSAAKQSGASLVGLSALMTTTVGKMEETVSLLKKEVPSCRVMVGGAVLTAEYAKEIGAHFYARDAMEGVRYAEEVYGG